MGRIARELSLKNLRLATSNLACAKIRKAASKIKLTYSNRNLKF